MFAARIPGYAWPIREIWGIVDSWGIISWLAKVTPLDSDTSSDAEEIWHDR